MIESNMKLWYGKYGGCFLADPFTLSCDSLYEAFVETVETDDFKKEFQEVTTHFENAMRFSILHAKYEDTNIIHIDENVFSIIGQALVAKHLNKKYVIFGARYVDEALLIAQVSEYLGLPLKLYMSKDIGSIASVLKYIKAIGQDIEIDTKMCKEIFDLPEMYAFQGWVTNSENCLLINNRSNVGAYPFTNIASYFSSLYGYKIIKHLEILNIMLPKRIVIPCITGSTALSIVKPLINSGIQFETVEIEDNLLKQEEDSYCGTYTLVMRDNERDRVICPEIAHLWNTGAVKRTFISAEDANKQIKKLIKVNMSFSIESAAAVKRACEQDNNVDTWVITGAERAGATI